jgi:hypothetical protein
MAAEITGLNLIGLLIMELRGGCLVCRAIQKVDEGTQKDFDRTGLSSGQFVSRGAHTELEGVLYHMVFVSHSCLQ